MKNLFIIIIIGLLISCNSSIKKSKEISAVLSVLNFYDGVCVKNTGFSITNKEKKRLFFELEISNSSLLEKHSKNLQIPASNIAYLFYKNVDKNQYDDIKVKIHLKNGNVSEFTYSTKDINGVIELERTISLINKKIINGEYTEIANYFDSKIKQKLNRKEIEKMFNDYDSIYGKINNIQLQGFSYAAISEDDSPIKLLHLSEVVIRDGHNTKLSLFFNKNSQKLYSISFDW